ncbi:putative gustatory receptor 58a [Haematobia irritans]|uniref:putative gustatory receptor 58a n=1 Tax=Haematobia irritans TaxID=7368 RepID=UPI003F4FCE2F
MFSKYIEQLEKLTWKITYYYALALGLTPAPVNLKTCRFYYSSTYLCYSVLIQVIFLLISPISTPLFASAKDRADMYMLENSILAWTYYFGKATRILTNLVLSVDIWQNRKDVQNLYENYWKFYEKYEQFYQLYNLQTEMLPELRVIRLLTICKFCSSHINAFVISATYIQMNRQTSLKYYLIEFTNFMQSFYLLQFGMEFFVILSRVHLHFVYINKSLEGIGSWKLPFQSIVQRCHRLWRMHFECYHLSRRILKLSQKITLVLLIKIFSTNINMLYHAVQFANGGVKSNGKSNLWGILSIVSFYFDTILTMLSIDNLLTSSNETSKVLHIYMDVEIGEENVQSFFQMVSQFHQYLACHHLTFYIFGLFSLNKTTCLKYFLSVVVHLTLLVQFDLKSK